MPLITEPWQVHILEKRFLIIERLKNDLIAYELRKYKNLERRRDFREINRQIDETPREERKPLYEQRTKMIRDAGFSEFDFKDDITPMQKAYVEHIQTQIAHAAASDVWRAFEKFLFSNGETVHYRRKGTLNSVACSKAGNGMIYKDGMFEWRGGRCEHQINFKIPVQAPRNDYERQMLEKRIVSMRVTRKWMKTRYKYYLQFMLEGKPASKGRTVGEGRVGIDIGTQIIAISSEKEARLLELADKAGQYSQKEAELMRKMSVSRRATNPNNYNSDGTVKPREECSRWVKSKNYMQYSAKVKDLMRRDAAVRRLQHIILANEIIAMGTDIYIEDKSFAKLAMRKKTPTEYHANGLAKSKKGSGKSIANKAPSELLVILNQKLKSAGKEPYHELKPFEYQAKYFDHTDGCFRDKGTPIRSRLIQLSSGETVHINLYAAYLMRCADTSLACPDRDLCTKEFGKFLIHHRNELDRIAKDTNVNHKLLAI